MLYRLCTFSGYIFEQLLVLLAVAQLKDLKNCPATSCYTLQLWTADTACCCLVNKLCLACFSADSWLQLFGAVAHSVQAEPCYASLLTRGSSSWELWLILFKLSLAMLLCLLVVTAPKSCGSFWSSWAFLFFSVDLVDTFLNSSGSLCWTWAFFCFFLSISCLELYPWLILSKLSSCLASLLMSQCLKGTGLLLLTIFSCGICNRR